MTAETAGQGNGCDALLAFGQDDFRVFQRRVRLLHRLHVETPRAKRPGSPFTPHHNRPGRAQVHGIERLLLAEFSFLKIINAHPGFVTPVAEGEHGFAVVGKHLFHATQALDAAVVFHDHALGVEIDQAILEHMREARLCQSHLITHVLQVAVTTFLATRTEVVAFREHHFDDRLARVGQFIGSGFHHHSIPHRFRAGRARYTVDFAGADPAGAQWWLDVLEVTQARNENAVLVGHLHQVAAGFRFNLPAIDGDGDAL